MELFTKKITDQLLANGRRQDPVRGTEEEIDFVPVVRLFMMTNDFEWLLAEIYPRDPDIAFGLADMGYGAPELGDVYIAELRELRGPYSLGVERDLLWTPKTLSEYAREASRLGRIAA